MKTIRIGAGAGFADDRIEPALELVERGDLDYIVFECLAERTIAAAQREKLMDPDAGYNPWLEDRMEAVLAPAMQRGTRIITNMGAAHPAAAAGVVAEVARRQGLGRISIALVSGDDVLDRVAGTDLGFLERPGQVRDLGDTIVSANAYTGVEGILEALRVGADVIVTGRVADPSLFLAPLIHEFGWDRGDWALMGAGTAVGHLLECGAHVTGGYFADPGRKDVPDLVHLGFPLAEVREDGVFTVTKAPGTGGIVSVQTVTEQLLYEVHDPAHYVTPDVVADFSGARLTERGADRVEVEGITGRPRTDTLKVSIGYIDSFIGEGEISYAGPNAAARGRLALDLVEHRLALIGVPIKEARYDLIAVDAVSRGAGAPARGEPREVRIRVAVRTTDLKNARRVGHEVVALWLNGPAGGGGARSHAYEDIAIVSTFVPRDQVVHAVEMIRAEDAAA